LKVTSESHSKLLLKITICDLQNTPTSSRMLITPALKPKQLKETSKSHLPLINSQFSPILFFIILFPVFITIAYFMPVSYLHFSSSSEVLQY
jgi:hypothetical protein